MRAAHMMCAQYKIKIKLSTNVKYNKKTKIENKKIKIKKHIIATLKIKPFIKTCFRT
jgi:hypothetical protein